MPFKLHTNIILWELRCFLHLELCLLSLTLEHLKNKMTAVIMGLVKLYGYKTHTIILNHIEKQNAIYLATTHSNKIKSHNRNYAVTLSPLLSLPHSPSFLLSKCHSFLRIFIFPLSDSYCMLLSEFFRMYWSTAEVWMFLHTFVCKTHAS